MKAEAKQNHNPSQVHPGSVAALVEKALALSADAAKVTVALSPVSRRRLLKFRTGGERVVGRVAQAIARYAAPDARAAAGQMATALREAEELVPLLTALETVTRRVSDTILERRARCWQGVTKNYALLELIARDNPAVLAELVPVREFFATGKRKAKTVPAAQALADGLGAVLPS